MFRTSTISSNSTSQTRPLSRLLAAAAATFVMMASASCVHASELDAASNHKTVAGKVTSAVESPLRDVNVMKTEIPAVLQDARAAPYAPIVSANCEILAAQIGLLDDALGKDLDAASPEAKPWSKEKVIDKAIDAGGDAASSVIPYRGVVRLVSGAEKHDKLVADSILAGSIRRGYLKGIGESMGCTYPGAPMRVVDVAP